MRSVKTAAKSAQGFCIVLDAGHGGFDPGAIGPGGVCEDGINLAIVKEAQVLLQERGYTVLLTRQDADALGQTKQSDMQQRRRMIMDSGCDLMISVHLNANADASCRGPVVLYRTGDEVSREAAQILQDALNEGLKIEKPRIIQTGEYFILRCTEAPSLIVEFIG